MNITADNLIAKCQKNIPDLGQRVEDGDWFYYFTEAIRDARSGRTLPWQRRLTTLEFFTNIFQYQLPTDFDSVIKPHKDMLVPSESGPFLLYGRDKDFFANNNYSLAIQWDREVKTLLAKQDSVSMVSLDNFEDDADQFTLGGDASGGVKDTVYYKDNTSALRFKVAQATGAFTISRTRDSAIDLTSYLNRGYAFLWVYMPAVIDDISIIYGSDSTNYYEIATISTDFYGNAFSTGWNLIQFDMKDATVTGSPDITSIDYYLITGNTTDVNDTNFRIDAFTFHIPSLLEFPYNSKNTIRDSEGEYKEAVTAGDDTILCDETFESAFMYDAIEKAAVFKLRDTELATIARAEKQAKYSNLNRRYPSVEAPVQSNYYSKYKSI